LIDELNRIVIFRSKYDNSKPNINFFVQTIYAVKSLEYIIAKKTKQTPKVFSEVGVF